MTNYNFNEDIIDALKDGKAVWFAKLNTDNWETLKRPLGYCLSAAWLNKWSLTKPKQMVTKTIERWMNIYTDGSCTTFNKESLARELKGDNCIATVYVSGTYEVEE